MTDAIDQIRTMSPEVLANVGAQALAYVRPVEVDGGQKAFGIFAANGMQMGIAPSRELAFITVRQHELMPVSVH
ncbi:DUF1150 family protein [Minwuia sp.]|uniref:DUF1150 family protein n=1 Tax=Minwuia sp. TaxID=2493630 RepID=UPI003A909904